MRGVCGLCLLIGGRLLLILLLVCLLGLRLGLARLLGLRIAAVARGRHAVALQLFIAQLGDDRRAYHFGNHVELAVLQAFVNDEAHEWLAVHGKAFGGRSRFQARFRFASERGVEAEKALVVVRVHEHGVQRGREFATRAHHFFAAHLLFSLLHYLNGRDGGVVHFPRCTLEGVFHFAFELGEESHGRLKPFCGFST